jgi:hypothetical protein
MTLELIRFRISKKRLEVQSVGLFQAKEECSKLKVRVFLNDLSNHLVNSIHDFYSLQMALAVIQEQKVSVDTLVSLHAQRTSSAEKAASLIEMQLKEAQASVVDLKSQLEQAKAGLKLAQETSIINEQSISSTLCERANELEKAVKDREQQIEELSRRSADILLRYQQANLVRSFRIVFSF